MKSVLSIYLLIIFIIFNFRLGYAQLDGQGMDGGDLQSSNEPIDPDEFASYAQAWLDASITHESINGDVLAVMRGGSSVGHSGSYSYVVPLSTPTGAGLSSPLSVGYNSSGGSGTLGVGWGLKIPFPLTLTYGYESRMEHGNNPLSKYDHHFYWSGRSLIETHETGGVTTTPGDFQVAFRVAGLPSILVKLNYKPDIEEVDPEDFNDYYAEVHLGTGIKLIYGLQREGITLADGRFGGWVLDRVEDAYGKNIQFSYDINERAVDQIDGTVVDATSEILLRHIHWTGLTPTALGPNRVTINYQDRADVNTSTYGSLGFARDMTKLVSEIVVSVNGEEVRSYDFTYSQSPLTGKSLLNEITSCIPDGTCLDPLTFEYSDDEVLMEESAGQIEGNWGSMLRTSQHRLIGDFLNTGGSQVAFLKESFKDPKDWSVPGGDADNRAWQLWDMNTGDVTSTFIPGVLSQGTLYGRRWSHPEDIFSEEKVEQLVFGQVGFQPFAGELDPLHPGTELGVPITCPCWPDENAIPLEGGDQLPLCSEYTNETGPNSTDINYQHAYGLLIIRFYKNNEEVTAKPTYHAFTEPVNQLHHADIDGDGVLDLVLSQGYDFKDSKWVISQNRASQLGVGREFVDAYSTIRSSVNDEVVIMDEDGDGKAEVLYTNAYSDETHDQPGELGEWVDAETDYFVDPYPADVTAYYGRKLLADDDPSKRYYRKLELVDEPTLKVHSFPTTIPREIIHSVLGNDERGMNAYFKANMAEDDQDHPWQGWSFSTTGATIGGRVPIQTGDLNGDGLQDYLVLRYAPGGLPADKTLVSDSPTRVYNFKLRSGRDSNPRPPA